MLEPTLHLSAVLACEAGIECGRGEAGTLEVP